MDALRISDADRASALDLLSEQYAQGRLDKDEFDERSDAVWSAKTQGDLAPVFADLPVRSPALPAHPAGRGTAVGTAMGATVVPAARAADLPAGRVDRVHQGAVRAAAHRALVRVRLAPSRASPDGAPVARSAQMSGRRFCERGRCS